MAGLELASSSLTAEEDYALETAGFLVVSGALSAEELQAFVSGREHAHDDDASGDRYAAMFPSFLDMKVDEIHVEMASREYAELEVIGKIAERADVAVGIIDVKSYYIETVDDIAAAVERCLQHAPAERLSFAPDCGLSQTARWAARQKLNNMVAGVQQVREKVGCP